VAKITNLRIPVTVTTDGVDTGIKKTEVAIQRLQGKLKRLNREQGGAGAGAQMGNRLTPFLGGIGKMGPAAGLLAGGGMAGAAAATPFAIAGLARAQVDQMAALTKGATDALQEFRMTGQQTFASNSVILERLASMESDAQKRAKVMGFGEAFAFGMARPGGDSLGDKVSLLASQVSTFVGSLLGGKSMEESFLTSQLQGATETEARILEQQMLAEERRQAAGPQGVGDVLSSAFLESTFFKLDKIIQMLGRQ
jgi:hypothetical protein